MVERRRSPGLDPDVGVDHVLISFNLAVLWDSKQTIKPAMSTLRAAC